MSKNEPKYDCFHDKPTVEPNGDISGRGVLAGFLGTTYLAILVLVGYYLFAFDPTKSPYAQSKGETSGPTKSENATRQEELDVLPVSQPGDSTVSGTNIPETDGHGASQLVDTAQTPVAPWAIRRGDEWVPNAVDVIFLTQARNLMHIRQHEAEESANQAKAEQIFNNCMRSLCDAQLMTGVGILLSAYCTLHAPDGGGGIMAYHWRIAVYLAWMSNLTYFTGLTFLRKYLAQSQNRAERRWRAIAMSGLSLLVLVSLQPLVYFNWGIDDLESEMQPATAASFAVCFFRLSDVKARMLDQNIQLKVPFSSASSTILSMCLLAFSFATRIVKLTSRYARFVRVEVRQRISQSCKRFAEKHAAKSEREGEAGWPVLAAHGHRRTFWAMSALLTGRLYADLYTSMLSEVYWAIAAALWATIRIFESRGSADVDEDEFTFGQILAMFLLASPVFTIFVALWPLRSELFFSIKSQTLGPEISPVPNYARSRRRLEDSHEAPQRPLSDEHAMYWALTDSDRSYGVPMSALVLTGVCLQALVATAIYFWVTIAQKTRGFAAIIDMFSTVLEQPYACMVAYAVIIQCAAEHPITFLPDVEQRETRVHLDTANNAAHPAVSKTTGNHLLLQVDCLMPFILTITMEITRTALLRSTSQTAVNVASTMLTLGVPLIVSLDFCLGRPFRRQLYRCYKRMRSNKT